MAFVCNYKVRSTVAVASLTPAQQYSAWATELGVSDTGTDMPLDGDDNLFIVDFGGAFLKKMNGISIGSFGTEASIGFYLSAITNPAKVISSITGRNRVIMPSDTPDILLTLSANLDGLTELTKFRRQGAASIIYGKHRDYYSANSVVYFALKIEDSKITVAVNAVDSPVVHRIANFNVLDASIAQDILLSQVAGDNHLIVLDYVTYKYPITITETLALSAFDVFVYYADSGILQSKLTVEVSGSLAMDVSTINTELVTIVITPSAKKWQADAAYMLGDIVYPTNPSANTHYFKRLQNGVSGSAEPSWSSAIGVKCNDGAVTDAWECVSGMVQPVINSYLLPTSDG